MDREIIARKLDSLQRCLQRIETKCPDDPSILILDIDLQDIISINLSRAVQLSVDIGAHLVSCLKLPPPNSMGQTFEQLEQAGLINANLATNLKKAIGFRNIAVHNYDVINWHIVYSIIKNHLVDFTEFATMVSGIKEL